MSASSLLNTSKCYATSNGDYLGKYKNTTSIPEGVVGRTTVCYFDEGIVHDADKKTFIEVDCRTVGSPNVGQDYVVDELGKRKCPICNAVEGGTRRIITHTFDCANKQGGRKNRKPTKKNRRRNRRLSKKNRRN